MSAPPQPLPAADPACRLALREDGGVTIMSFTLPPDGVAIRQMYETAVELTNQRNTRLLIDLAGVPMVSSGVMGMLVTIKKKFMQTGGQLHVAVPNPQVMTSFHVMNLHLVLQLFADAAEARQKFKA